MLKALALTLPPGLQTLDKVIYTCHTSIPGGEGKGIRNSRPSSLDICSVQDQPGMLGMCLKIKAKSKLQVFFGTDSRDLRVGRLQRQTLLLHQELNTKHKHQQSVEPTFLL